MLQDLVVSNPNVSKSYKPNPTLTCTQDPSTGYAKYANVDCTQNVLMSFDFDLSYLRAGVTACVYLVPMKFHIDPNVISSYYYYKEKGTVNDASYAKPYVDHTLLLDNGSANSSANISNMKNFAEECGMGYNDAQGVGMGGSIEIDCIEATPCGLSVTLHGKSTSDSSGYDKGGVWCNVHNNMSEGCTLVKRTNGISSPIVGVDLSTYGPSSAFFINTLLLFKVNVTMNYASDTLTMTVVILQGTHSLVFTVASGGFPRSEGVEHMNVIVSLWMTPPAGGDHDTGTSWWLDGYKVDHEDEEKTSVRGACAERTYEAIPTVSYDTTEQDVSGASLFNSLNANYRYYDEYAIPVAADQNRSGYNPSIFILKNMNVSNVVNLPTANSLPVYIQDFMYRGQGGSGQPEYFTGRYDSAYGVAYLPNDTDVINKNGFIPAVTSTVPATTDSAYWKYQVPDGETLNTDYSFGGKLSMKNMAAKEIVGSGYMGTVTTSNYMQQHNIGSFFFDATNVVLNGRTFS